MWKSSMHGQSCCIPDPNPSMVALKHAETCSLTETAERECCVSEELLSVSIDSQSPPLYTQVLPEPLLYTWPSSPIHTSVPLPASPPPWTHKSSHPPHSPVPGMELALPLSCYLLCFSCFGEFVFLKVCISSLDPAVVSPRPNLSSPLLSWSFHCYKSLTSVVSSQETSMILT